MTGEYVIEIRRWLCKITGKRYPQYRLRGANSLAWIPMGEYQARKALKDGVFLGCRVEEIFDESSPKERT